jgi:uncharacterized protein
VKVEIRAKGHHNILSLHRNTLELTKEDHLTPRGDCIVAVAADKTMADLPEGFKSALRQEGAVLEITMECGGQKDTVKAHGHPDLILDHPTDMVVRKSRFICPRTLALSADKASCDIDRKLVDEMRKGGEVMITLDVG